MYDNLHRMIRRTPLARLLALGLLTLILMVPIGWIQDLVTERRLRHSEAVTEVAAKWGLAQEIIGPALVVPYTLRWTELDYKGNRLEMATTHQLTILPQKLRIQAHTQTESLRRGIYVVPVYKLTVDIAGTFSLPADAEMPMPANTIDWSRARLLLGVSDARAIQGLSSLHGGERELAFEPGVGDWSGIHSGIHSAIDLPFAAPTVDFATQIHLNGSSGVYFGPAGAETTVDISSDWPSPSFQGDWLPSHRSIEADGFQASWKVLQLARNFPRFWTSNTDATERLKEARFGVDLISPVNEHSMADRSVKYAMLFILMTFVTVWLIEIIGQVSVHPIEYLLFGAALCTFYLLELSLAEQLGFALAYTIASAAVVALIGAYAVRVLHGVRRALGVVSTVAILYLNLYVLLTNEDYALMLGSFAVFAAVAMVMFLTRQVDWYGAAAESAVGTEPLTR
jgi:inner membrane protein